LELLATILNNHILSESWARHKNEVQIEERQPFLFLSIMKSIFVWVQIYQADFFKAVESHDSRFAKWFSSWFSHSNLLLKSNK